MRRRATGEGRVAAAHLVCSLLVVGVAGCAHRAVQPPQLVHRFAEAVAGHDWDSAYGMMSTEYRARVPLVKFRGQMEAEPATVGGDAAILAGAALRGARSEVETPSGDRLLLVLEGDQWRLEVQPLEPFGQQSPRAALRTLIRAVDRRRYDLVLRLVPARRRAAVTEETLRAYWEGGESEQHRRLLDRLRVNLNAPIIDLGTEAHMPLGTASTSSSTDTEGEARFLLEDGVWKIDDIK